MLPLYTLLFCFGIKVSSRSFILSHTLVLKLCRIGFIWLKIISQQKLISAGNIFGNSMHMPCCSAKHLVMCCTIVYASQHIWWLSQARLSWEVVPGRAYGIKMMGMTEVGAPVSLNGVASIGIVGASACVIVTLHQKTQKMASKDTDCWISHHGRLHMPTQTGDGETQPECSTTLC